jgi:hypothetical protein
MAKEEVIIKMRKDEAIIRAELDSIAPRGPRGSLRNMFRACYHACRKHDLARNLPMNVTIARILAQYPEYANILRIEE